MLPPWGGLFKPPRRTYRPENRGRKRSASRKNDKIPAVNPLQVISDVMRFCYPGVCACCNEASEASWAICENCGDELHALESAPACERCAAPTASAGAPCARCLGKGIYPFDKILRLGNFTDPLKAFIHQIKYHQRWPLAENLADRLLAQERVKGLLMETQCLVAVPLHRWRQVWRGYNQSEVIASRLGKRCGIRLAHPIVRLRSTETQTHFARSRREENVRHAFGLSAGRAIRHKHVVVIDDVMTSGATLQEVGRTLLEASPASLCAIVLAVADPKGRDFEVI